MSGTAELLRLLLTRRWLTALALAVLFAILTVLLGNWQYSRHEDKVAARDRVESHYDADPVPLASVLTGEAPLAPEQEWIRVQVSGEYAGADQLFVRNRPHEGTFGYAVIVPLETDSGTLAVDRGWVRNAENAATLPDVPSAPPGEVVVTGWLRPSETDLERELPTGQLASINLPGAAQAWDRPVLGAYLVLGDEGLSDAPGEQLARPLAAGRPSVALGSHFAYSLQWWLSAPVGLILVLVMARREWQDGLEPGALSKRAAAPRKVRIWDEEDE